MEQHWYAVRCVFAFDGYYEERITLWSTANPEDVIAKAENEATDYADPLDARFTGLSQSYWLADTPGEEGAEIFSLMRDSQLEPDDYLGRFFDTGAERQRQS